MPVVIDQTRVLLMGFKNETIRERTYLMGILFTCANAAPTSGLLCNTTVHDRKEHDNRKNFIWNQRNGPHADIR